MYFWKIEELKKDLVSDEMPQLEQLKYLLAFWITAPLLDLEFLGSNPLNIIFETLMAIMALAGIVFAYRANGGPKGLNFLSRYLSVSWVTFVRIVLVFSIPVGVVLYSLDPPGYDQDIYNIEDIIFVGTELLVILLVIKHISWVSNATSA